MTEKSDLNPGQDARGPQAPGAGQAQRTGEARPGQTGDAPARGTNDTPAGQTSAVLGEGQYRDRMGRIRNRGKGRKPWIVPGSPQDARIGRQKASRAGQGKTGRLKGDVIRTEVYDTFVIWSALPAVLRGQPQTALASIGMGDPITQDLLTIRTQTEFSKRFKVSEPTLCAWNARPDLYRRIEKARTAWAKKLTSNCYTALYKGLLKEGDASRFKIWMQVVEGWIEESRSQHTGKDGADLFQNLSQVSDEELERRIREITGRIGDKSND